MNAKPTLHLYAPNHRRRLTLIMMAYLLFWISVLSIGLHVLYPCLIILLSLFVKRKKTLSLNEPAKRPFVSVVIPVHGNATAYLQKKIENILHSDYPKELLEIIVGGDGDPPGLHGVMKSFSRADNVKYFQTGVRVGKNEVLNRAVDRSEGDVLIFSDVDALFESDAIACLVNRLDHPRVGGLCGKHIIQRKGVREGEKESETGTLQSLYWRYEAWIKNLEMQTLGSVTSNYGTIFALKKPLFSKLPPNVTDDLFLALSVVKSRHRFLYEPKALAHISPPSKDLHSEMNRRRRIVGRSLNSIWLNRKIFRSPDLLAVSLFIHKVLRRLTPLFLLIMLFSSLLLAWSHAFWGYVFALQFIFYAFSASVLLGMVSSKPFAVFGYFAAVNIGTFLGISDFLRGRGVAVWE